jgi:hypothetical protein
MNIDEMKEEEKDVVVSGVNVPEEKNSNVSGVQSQVPGVSDKDAQTEEVPAEDAGAVKEIPGPGAQLAAFRVADRKSVV